MKILVWATSFGADLWSLVHTLEQDPEVELRIIMGHPENLQREGIASLRPLRSPLLKRRWYHQLLGVPGFSPEVTVMDNWLPYRRLSPAGVMLWHGFGWKGPNDLKEFAHLHRCIRRTWGSAMRPNSRFVWQTFGPHDFQHRSTVSGMHPDNCRQTGAASHDYLRQPLPKKVLQPYYPFDVIGRPTVLLAPTWHYGEVFTHWGGDRQVLALLLRRLQERGVNIILRLHDSFRYSRKYLVLLRELITPFPQVVLKFKDHHPDNMLDMQVADLLITNFSSIANQYYATGRPTIHIYPVADADERFLWRRYSPALGVYGKSVASARFIWKFPPEDNGGLLARSPEEMCKQLDLALDDPSCCQRQAREFLDRHMLGADGCSCQRIRAVLEELTHCPGRRG